MVTASRRPLERIRKLVGLWGWNRQIRCYKHRFVEKHPQARQQGRVLTWYEAGRSMGGGDDCFLQINEYPQGQTVKYVGAVYAIRYRIFTGWHKFRLPNKDAHLEREAHRLDEWLNWNWFASIKKRREFRRLHPECTGYTWHRIAQQGPHDYAKGGAGGKGGQRGEKGQARLFGHNHPSLLISAPIPRSFPPFPT
jgi:hypothetical protein